jgi:uncharacterized membrane protein
MAAVDETTLGPSRRPGPASGRRAAPAAAARHTLTRIRSSTVAERIVYGIASGYAVVFALFAVARHLAFQTQSFDLGIMTQAIWNTLHGHFLEVTTQRGEQITRLAVHVDPFLALLAPVWLIWPSPAMLLVFQALAVSVGALPVFWLARKHLASERGAVFFALAYLLFPATQFNAIAVASDSGFHPVSIAIPLLLFAIWFLDEDRLVAFAVVGVLVASTKEEMPLVVGLLGLWYAVRRGRWRFGLPVLGVGLALTLFDFLVVIPHFLHGKTVFGDWYSPVGGTPGGVLRTAVTDPMALVHVAATGQNGLYLLLLGGPFLFLWLLEPLLALAAMPDLAINLLSNQFGQSSIAYHYTAGIAPFVVAASIFGLSRFRRQAPRIALYVLAACVSLAVYSPLRLGAGHLAEALPSNPIHQAKAEAVSLVPADVPVAASNQLAAHLSERRRILIFPFAIREARWIVLDEADPSYDRQWYRRRIERVRRNPDWRLTYSARGVFVFHRLGQPRDTNVTP